MPMAEPKVAQAQLRYFRASPKKVRLVIKELKGKPALEVMQILQFVPKRFARDLYKLVKSAVANAEQKGLNKEKLMVKEFICNEGPRLKRYRPGSRGVAYPYTRKLCHIKVVLEEVATIPQKEKAKGKNKAKK